jgi:quercetin dioxygenase-like cupin family protein
LCGRGGSQTRPPSHRYAWASWLGSLGQASLRTQESVWGQDEDSEVKYRPAGSGEIIEEGDYSKRVIFSPEDFEEEGHLLQVVTVPPRTRQRLHLHRQQTEVFYVLEGRARIDIEGEEYLARPGDAFICSPGDRHSLWNQSDGDFKLVVFKINKPEGNDSVWLEEQRS